MNRTFEEKMVSKLLKENLIFDLAGFENAVQDGDMSFEEVEKHFSIDNMLEMATKYLNDAMKKGNRLETPESNACMEAKHLNFLGTEKLLECKQIAVASTLTNFISFLSSGGK